MIIMKSFEHIFSCEASLVTFIQKNSMNFMENIFGSLIISAFWALIDLEGIENVLLKNIFFYK